MFRADGSPLPYAFLDEVVGVPILQVLIKNAVSFNLPIAQLRAVFHTTFYFTPQYTCFDAKGVG